MTFGGEVPLCHMITARVVRWLFLVAVARRDARRYITRVWASYVAQSRLLAAAAATSATAAVAATAGASRTGLPDGVGDIGAGSLPAPTFQFGLETEPGPLDQTGQLPNELLESMFDYLDEDQTMNCASVARR